MKPFRLLQVLSPVLIFVTLFVAWQTDLPAEEARGPSVLVLHSYAPDYSWTRGLHDGIVSVLPAPEVRARYRVEYMDANHHTSPAYTRQLLSLYREKKGELGQPSKGPRSREITLSGQKIRFSRLGQNYLIMPRISLLPAFV